MLLLTIGNPGMTTHSHKKCPYQPSSITQSQSVPAIVNPALLKVTDVTGKTKFTIKLKVERKVQIKLHLGHGAEFGVALEQVLEVFGIQVGVLEGHQGVKNLQVGLTHQGQ